MMLKVTIRSCHLSLLAPIRLNYQRISKITWLDDVSCRGTEARLIDCARYRYGTRGCSSSGDAGVYCPVVTCPQGSIRLVGDNTTQGRVEICVSNIWRAICDRSWTNINARVACRQLGLLSSCMQVSYTFCHGS